MRLRVDPVARRRQSLIAPFTATISIEDAVAALSLATVSGGSGFA